MSFQYYWLGRQVKKMEDWRKAHRRGRRPRGPSDKVRDVGEIVGRRDDGVADPNEEYEKDSFIASDSEEVEEDLAEDASTSEASTSHRKPGSENSVEGWEKQSHTANVRPFSAVLFPFHMFAIAQSRPRSQHTLKVKKKLNPATAMTVRAGSAWTRMSLTTTPSTMSTVILRQVHY